MISSQSNKSTILIVDDSPTNIKVLGESLKSLYRVRLATNGSKALEIAGSPDPPDIILLDIIMPDMDGYEVCRRLKADSNTKNIPVIFITAKDEEKDETRGLALGAVDYITKPFSLAIVKARLKTHIELKHHRDVLENLSSLDGLTGIPNRRRLDEVLSAEWKKAIVANHPVSLIILDIDHFKLFNDNFGHVAGDDCLKMVAALLKQSIHRPQDMAARYGGEEFVILLPSTDMAGAKSVAEGFMTKLNNAQIAHAFSLTSDHLTCSLGIATIEPTEENTIPELFENADKCLYQAKMAGRNRYHFIDLTIPSSEE